MVAMNRVGSRSSPPVSFNIQHPAYYVCAEGTLAGNADAELTLYEAFERGGFEFMLSLLMNEPTDPMRRWYGTPSSLVYDEAGWSGKK
jgi:hypothetical protein